MSHVKMLSIDLMTANDPQSDPSSTGELGSGQVGKGNDFAKLVDSELSQHGNASNSRNENKPANGSTKSADTNEQRLASDEATQSSAQSRKPSATTEEATAEQAEEHSTPDKLSEPQTSPQETENADNAAENGEQFIKMLAKSEQLLTSKAQEAALDESMRQVLIDKNTQHQSGKEFVKSPLSEVIQQSIISNSDEDVAQRSEGERLLAQVGQQKQTIQIQDGAVKQAVLAELVGENGELSKEDLAALIDELPFDGKGKKLSMAEFKALVEKAATNSLSANATNQNTMDSDSSTTRDEFSEADLQAMLEQTNARQALTSAAIDALKNKGKPVDGKPVNGEQLSLIAKAKQQLAAEGDGQFAGKATDEQIQAELTPQPSMQQASTTPLPPNADMNKALAAGAGEKRVNSPTQQVVMTEEDNLDALLAGQDQLTEQDNEQAVNQQQSVNLGTSVNNKSVIAETLANMSQGKQEVEQATSEQKSTQQQIDSIANRVIESNQEFKKVEQVKQETINIYRRDFANAVKDKVMVMISQKLQQVDIQLDPPELGNVHVRLNLQGEQAAVSFTVQNQQAKEAFEQQLGKLREMLQESGVDVGDANVSQQQKGDGEAQEQGFAGQSGLEGEDSLVVEESLAHLVNHSATGVDFYA